MTHFTPISTLQISPTLIIAFPPPIASNALLRVIGASLWSASLGLAFNPIDHASVEVTADGGKELNIF